MTAVDIDFNKYCDVDVRMILELDLSLSTLGFYLDGFCNTVIHSNLVK